MVDDKITEIFKILKADKLKVLENSVERLKKKKALKKVDLIKLLAKEKKETRIKTGTLIDDIIGGGLPPNSSLLLYGEYGSSKTQTCFTMAVECPDDVIYIDAEGSFRAERIQQICEGRGKDWNKVIEKIHLFQPDNWVEQLLTLYSFPSPPDTVTGKIGLIIVDSLTKLFRGVEFAGRQNLTIKQPLLREFMFKLKLIVEAYGAALIYTTQIYESPSANPVLASWTSHKAVGGSSILHQPAFIIFMRRSQGNIRIARMMDSSWQPLRERPFVITEKGIENMPADAKAAKGLLKKAKDFEAKQKQEILKKKEKEKKKNKPSEKEE